MLALAVLVSACGEADLFLENADGVEALASELESSSSLVGVHSPPNNLLGEVVPLMSKKGWLMEVNYANEYDYYFHRKALHDARRAAGFVPVVRLDYAKDEAVNSANSKWAGGGATIPPPGPTDGNCPRRAPDAPKRALATHVECWNQWIDHVVSTTSSVHTWVIGNEPNLKNPGAGGFANNVIPPDWYVKVFKDARARIRAVPGHSGDAVLVAGMSPNYPVSWNATGYSYSGEEYWRKVLGSLPATGHDGIAVHAYGGWVNPDSNRDHLSAADHFALGAPGFIMGFESQAKLFKQLGHDNKPLLITEFSGSIGNALPPNDLAAFSDFLSAAYARINTWNKANPSQRFRGAIWYDWSGKSAGEVWGITELNHAGTSGANPYKTFQLLAASGGVVNDRSPVVGNFDRVDANSAAGWAYDPDLGTGPVTVELYKNGALWQTALANARRTDLVTAGVAPNPEHGFSISTRSLAPGSYVLEVKARNHPGNQLSSLYNPRKLLAIYGVGFGQGMTACPSCPRHTLRASNGQYVVADWGGGGAVLANRTVPSAWETFRVLEWSEGVVSLQSYDGHYLTAVGGGGGALNASATTVGANEKFTLEQRGGGKVALRTAGNFYVVAEGGGGGSMNANRKAIGAWETFGWAVQP